jgi:hypothetical protein
MANTMPRLLSARTLDEYKWSRFWRTNAIYSFAAGQTMSRLRVPNVRGLSRRLSYGGLVAGALATDLAARGGHCAQRVVSGCRLT